jgi:hypothetical protein
VAEFRAALDKGLLVIDQQLIARSSRSMRPDADLAAVDGVAPLYSRIVNIAARVVSCIFSASRLQG